MHLGPGTEATFVAGEVGRRGALALWHPEEPAGTRSGHAVGPGNDTANDRPDDTPNGTVTVVLPDGIRELPAWLVPVADAIGPLAALPASTEVRPSVRALAVATRLALDLISRGRLLPAAAGSGADEWRIGPLDVADRVRIEQLADALPAPVHALAVDDPQARYDEAPDDAHRMLSPHAAAAAYLDAVADAFVRTASAPAIAGGDAFAGPGITDVTAAESWLHSVTAGTGGDTMVGLRI